MFYCTSLTKITIPSKVSFIGDNAFSYSGLKRVKSLLQNPCPITSNAFGNVSSNATLYVPKGSVSKYQEAAVWNAFMMITDNLLGDVNNDGVVNSADVIEVVNIIMNNGGNNGGGTNGDDIYDEDRRKELYRIQKLSTTVVKEDKIYPNDPCPCGSGKKYKKCCGRKQ